MPRRAKGEGTLFRRRDGKWVAEIVLHRVATGAGHVRVSRKKAVANTKAEAAEALREMLVRYKHHTGTFAEHLKLWLAEGRHAWKPATYAAYESRVRNYIVPWLGNFPVNGIRVDDVRAWMDDLARKRVGPVTRKRTLKTAAQAFRQLQLEDKSVGNPFAVVRPPRVPPADVYVPDEKEFARILAAADQSQLRTLVLLAATTGMRLGEMAALQWSDIDFAKKCIHVTATLARDYNGELQRATPKTRAACRIVGVPDIVVGPLEELRRERALGTLSEAPWVFCNAKGLPLDRHNFRKRVWLPLLEKAGVPAMHFHALRHFGNSLMIDAGVPILVVAARLGHADTRMTLDRYGHIIRAAADREATETVNGRFRQMLSPAEINCPTTASENSREGRFGNKKARKA